MKRLFHFSFLLIFVTSFSQTYFFEDFNYESFEELDTMYRDTFSYSRWSTHHAVTDIDLSENGRIDLEEEFKRTSVVKDPFDENNRIIKFELNKIDPYYYAKYSCDDSKNQNEISDNILLNQYDPSTDLYCTNCKDSPKGTELNEYKIHMNRNELATYGPNRRLYKANKEYWFGLQMLIDDSYELDSIRNGEVVTQWHPQGRGGINPPIALLIVEGRFKLTITKNNDGKGDVYDLGEVVKGQWITWKYHIILSKKDNDGLVEVWKNNEKLVSVSGRNSLKNYRVYLKFGIYKWGWWDCTRPYNYSSRKVISFDKVWADNNDRDN